MKFFSKKISYFLIVIFLSNIFIFSYHFMIIPHRWNPVENRFEHYSKNYDDINRDSDNASTVFITTEKRRLHENNECAVIYFLMHQKVLESFFSTVLCYIFLLKYLSTILKEIILTKEILFFAPKKSPPFSI